MRPRSTTVSEPADGQDAIQAGSDNVFADLGFDAPGEELLKADLVLVIADRIERLGLSQTKVAVLMGISQPDVSKLLRGRTAGYSLERLIEFVRALGHDVEIRIAAPASDGMGRLRLHVSDAA